VVCNNQYFGCLPEGMEWVELNPLRESGYPIFQVDLADVKNPGRHDAAKLAKTVMDLLFEKTGPLSSKEDSSSL
jgi:hypothetical protein